MPRGGHNRAPAATKRRYFELIRQGARGSEASTQVGVSLSCGSLWFIDAGSVTFIDAPISSRYLSQDDRIEIADGLAAGGALTPGLGHVESSSCWRKRDDQDYGQEELLR